MDRESAQKAIVEEIQDLELLRIYLQRHGKDLEAVPGYDTAKIKRNDKNSVWDLINPVTGKRVSDEVEELRKQGIVEVVLDKNEYGLSGWTIHITDDTGTETEVRGDVITTVNNQLIVPTAKDLQDMIFVSETAENSLFRWDADSKKRVPVTNFQVSDIMIVLKVYIEHVKATEQLGGSIVFNFYELQKETGKGYRTDKEMPRDTARRAGIIQFVETMRAISGSLPGDSRILPIFNNDEYDPETGQIIFSSPLFDAMLKYTQVQKSLQGTKTPYLWYDELTRADFCAERSEAAKEIAIRMLQKIRQRGTGRTDGALSQYKGKSELRGMYTTTIHVNDDLIKACPNLRKQIEGQPTTRNKTAILQRTLLAGYRILLTKTDAPAYYKDLRLPGKPIKQKDGSTIQKDIIVKSGDLTEKRVKEILKEVYTPTYPHRNERLYIRHRGANPQYRKPKDSV